jgi:hypothetical protein
MNCHLCGINWAGVNKYCPQCGSPSGTARRDWSWLIALGSAAAGAVVVLLILGGLQMPWFRKLTTQDKAQLAIIETQMKQVDEELEKCPAQQEKLLHQIGDEGKNPDFDVKRNRELQDKFEESVRRESQLTEQRADLERKRKGLLNGTRR